MKYIKYLDIPRICGIKKDDVVFVSSDITDLFITCKRNGEIFDANTFIDKLIESVGAEGTLLFPTYNWDFCKGITFDYNKTKCLTGFLGQVALKRKDFRRTKHPIYSFAVYGKDKDYLCNLDNVSSFGSNSPFAYFEKVGAKNVIIGLHYNECFTYNHYVEQKVGVPYRFEKTFKANYIDELGNSEMRCYSMYVRYLDLDVDTNFIEMGQELEDKGVSVLKIINGIPFRIIDMKKCVPLIENDIRYNKCRKICIYTGQ